MAGEEGCVGSPVYVDTHNGQCMWCVNGTHYCECWRVDETTNTTSSSLNASLCTGKPPKLELHGGDCVSQCPSGSYRWLDHCLESCPDGKVIWNTTVCLERCPSGLFARQQSPATSHPNQICDRSCPDDQWKYDGRCVAQCPGDAQYMLAEKHQCTERCPVEYFVLGLYCHPRHESCLDTAGCNGPTPGDCKVCFAQIHKPCLQRCPDATPYYNQIQDNITLYRCESVCFWPHVQSQIGMGRIACVDFCPPNQTYVINKVCTDETTCPVDYPYHYQRHNMTECSVECPASHYYLPGHLCADRCQCPENRTFAVDGVCRSNCSNTKPFVKREYTEPITKTCIEACSSLDVHADDEMVCLRSCPQHKPYKILKVCYSVCPEGYTNSTGYNSKRCIPTTNILNAIRKSYGGVVCMVIFFAQLFATIWCVRKSSKKISEAERRRLMESLICRNANQ